MIKDIYLLVGGEATRLRPLSEGIPKALLTIKGEPLIDLILDNLSNTDIENINLICSIKHESQWKEYQGNSKFNIKLHFEKEKLDTAGYIVQNINNFEEKFICMNGDLLINMDFSLFLNEVDKVKNSTICSITVDDPSRYGVLDLDGPKIINFVEKPQDLQYGNNISLGVYCLFKEDPDKTSRDIRKKIEHKTGKKISVIICDTFGRAWRKGQTNVAIGSAGIEPLESYIGEKDTFNNELFATEIAIVDELAGAAELVMKKSDNIPIVIIKGVKYNISDLGVDELIRDAQEDFFL